MEDTLETAPYVPTNSPEVQDPNYTFYPLPDVGPNAVDTCPPGFMNTFEEVFPSMAAPDQLSSMMVNTSFGAESFCSPFYPSPILNTKESGGDQNGMEQNESSTFPELPKKPPFQPADIHSHSPGEVFVRCKQEPMAELPDSDSGLSLNTSQNVSSPEKSVYGDGSFGFSDSDTDEMDINPGSAESDYSEMFSLNFQPDDVEQSTLVMAHKGQPHQQQEKLPKHHQTKPAEETGQSDAPFTKDKKKRSEVRLSRDQQRAKALQIPFTVDMIINLPVDDFTEMISKHQLNEPQLALVRDIRRRGKNKVAAQNCRKRKMENIVGLEYDLDSLKDEKERLLKEKRRNDGSLRKVKQQLSRLYLEVFSILRDEEGKPYSPSDYSLQQTTDGSVFLVPRVKKTLVKNKEHKPVSTL